jgi:hypothetical protein
MSVIYTFLAIITCLVGCHLLNHQGSLSKVNRNQLFGYGLNLVSCILVMQDFGALRGLFVYLGLVSFVGMVYSLSLYKYQKAQ